MYSVSASYFSGIGFCSFFSPNIIGTGSGIILGVILAIVFQQANLFRKFNVQATSMLHGASLKQTTAIALKLRLHLFAPTLYYLYLPLAFGVIFTYMSTIMAVSTQLSSVVEHNRPYITTMSVRSAHKALDYIIEEAKEEDINLITLPGTLFKFIDVQCLGRLEPFIEGAHKSIRPLAHSAAETISYKLTTIIAARVPGRQIVSQRLFTKIWDTAIMHVLEEGLATDTTLDEIELRLAPYYKLGLYYFFLLIIPVILERLLCILHIKNKPAS